MVARISEIATTIAGAVERQTSTTSAISGSISAVADAAGVTSRVTDDSTLAAESLARMSTSLQELVRRFRLAEASDIR